jgi:DnaA-homolog protein
MASAIVNKEHSAAQLTLGLSLRDEATFNNFYPGKNAELISLFKKMVQGEGERVFYLCGTKGHGLSHLLQACCHEAHQSNFSSVYLPLAELSQSVSSSILDGLETLSLICIDDLDCIAANNEWEEAIFHLYNRIYDSGGRIVIAAHALPKALHLQLPDLVSRLSWGIVYPLHSLSDEEKFNVFMMRAKARGLCLADEVAHYILTHSPRQMSHLFAALEKLDQASLVAKRRLTIPFVKEVLHI